MPTTTERTLLAEASAECSPRLTRRQAAILSAYTGFLCGPFSDMHELAEKLLGRPVWSHEFASKTLAADLAERAKPLFLEICAND